MGQTDRIGGVWLGRRRRRDVPRQARGTDRRRRRHGQRGAVARSSSATRAARGKRTGRSPTAGMRAVRRSRKNVAGRVTALFERTIVSCTAGLPRRPPPFDPSCGSRLFQTAVRGRARRATWSRPCRHVSGFGSVCLDGLPASVQPTVAATIPSFLPRARRLGLGTSSVACAFYPARGNSASSTRRSALSVSHERGAANEAVLACPPPAALAASARTGPLGFASAFGCGKCIGLGGLGPSAQSVGFIGRPHRDDDRRAGGPPGGFGAAGAAKDVLPG
jgi:hypothetical protein